ncbi:MAG: SCP2 sterol-binding domain-containing protein [Solirubrobacteraceae bacterium]
MERNTTSNEQQTGSPPAQSTVLDVPALAGLSGRMRVDVRDEPAAPIHLDHGRIWATAPGEEAVATAVVEDRADFQRMLAGELNPVVAAIQGRLWLHGDPELAVRVIFALNAARPFAGHTVPGGG